MYSASTECDINVLNYIVPKTGVPKTIVRLMFLCFLKLLNFFHIYRAYIV